MTTDLRDALRRLDPGERPLLPRGRQELLEVASFPGAGPLVLLLDTRVYIDCAAGRLARAVRELIDRSVLFHCSVALAELATGVARADPALPGWPALRDHYGALFADIPASRLMTPDAEVWADAGVIAGILARTQGFEGRQRAQCLNDALIFLTAAKAGLTVLTANRGGFDIIQQIAPEGRFILY